MTPPAADPTEPDINVLLVDDEARNLDVLEVILANPGYRLIRALTGDDALRVLLKHDVAAIVLDVRMPDVSGMELAQMIKGNRRFSQIPIVFLTAHLLDEKDMIAGYDAGAVDYLTKPVNPVVLRHKVAAFAELFRKTRALAELNATLETRVKERTAELEASEAALRAAARQKDEFLATLAHELRNPLAPLRMGLDLLLRAGNGETNRTLKIMNRQLDHMVRLIDDLLDVARISGGKLELKKQRTNLAECVQTALDTCRPFVEQRKQVVTTHLNQGLFGVVDPTRVVQIVGNLVHNASKFTPEGGKLAIELEQVGERGVVRVIDSGVGIAPGQIEHVFQMFARLERSSSSGNDGLGIGLALSRKLAEMHDGELTVNSAGLGQGSVFTLALPAEVAEPPAGPVSVRPPAPASTAAPVKVLIIEDNQDSAEVLALSLEGKGYATSVAHTGPTGLALLQQMQPRIVLCDIGLPEMDGVEVCRRVRQLELGYRPIMIALTGWGMADDRRRTQESGFDHHLVKPVEPKLLFEMLEGVAGSALGA